MDLRKQAIGIDISKGTFTACLGRVSHNSAIQLSPTETFDNTKSGFNRLLRWAKPMIDTDTPLVFLMESTGVYYQKLAHHLHRIGKTMYVVLPNKSAHYGKSLNVKTKTDSVDAQVLARFGLERSHKAWQPSSPVITELRNLTRYYVQLQQQKTAMNNMVQSKQAAHHVQSFIISSNKQLIRQIDRQIERCKQQIEQLITSDQGLSGHVDQLASIKGVGRLTVAVILAESRMFEGIENIRQIAGYDVVERQSGTSVKGKTRISKKGNRYLRNALYFPAMVACRFNPDLKAFYQRVAQNKPSKMIAQVAVQLKLLVLMYSLCKERNTVPAGLYQSSPDTKGRGYAR